MAAASTATFCPATQSLPARYKRILRTVLDDWYLHGMVVTEAELIADQFQWLEKRLERELDAAIFIDHPNARNPRSTCWRSKSAGPSDRTMRPRLVPIFSRIRRTSGHRSL
jgi:hypothetical protein